MTIRTGWVALAVLAMAVAAGAADGPAGRAVRRRVLLEMYTSQGCDSCPSAETLLGKLGEADPSLVALDFHVDYFNTPWKDPLSSKAYSEREWAYNTVKKRDLYFTPMLMVDGRTPMLGSNAPEAARAIAAAKLEAPGADLAIAWDGPASGNSRPLKVEFRPRAASSGRQTLIGVAVTEDPVVTKVLSGENGGKTLVDRHAVRSFRFENVNLKAGESKTLRFVLPIPEGSDPSHLAVAAFAQDWADGRIHQADSARFVDPRTSAALK